MTAPTGPAAGPANPRILLTGASGVVGAAVLSALADSDVVALTHSTPLRDPGPRVRGVRGDLGAPGLGLDPRVRAEVAAATDVVVHCAAVTDFRTAADRTSATNVRGTEGVLQFVADAGARLVHLSTAFLHRRHLAPPTDVPGSPAAYLESKLAAEDLVAGSGLPYTLVRPSIVLGDSRTGAAAGFQALHAVVSGLLRGDLPVLPLGRDAPVDFVPSDLLAAAVRRACSTAAPEVVWATSGAAALSAGELAELTLEVGREAGLAAPAPRFASVRAVERSLGSTGAGLPARVRDRYREVLALSSLFASAQPFPSDLVDAAGTGWAAGAGPADPPREVLRRCFAASARYLVQERPQRQRPQPPHPVGLEPVALATGT